MYKTRAEIFRDEPDILKRAKIPDQAGDLIAACLTAEPEETPQQFSQNVREGLLLIADAHGVVIEPYRERAYLDEEAIRMQQGHCDPSRVCAWLRPHLTQKEDEDPEDFEFNIQQALRTLALLFQVEL